MTGINKRSNMPNIGQKKTKELSPEQLKRNMDNNNATSDRLGGWRSEADKRARERKATAIKNGRDTLNRRY